MRFRFLLSRWRRFLFILGAILAAVVLVLMGLFFWLCHASEDKAAVIPFARDKSLILEKKGPGGIPYSVDNTFATFRLDVASPDKYCDRLFPSYSAALKFAADSGLPSIPSVQLIHGKCKQFDDELCATLEQALQAGTSAIPSKAQSLLRLAQKLIDARNTAPPPLRQAFDEPISYVATAISLGGGTLRLDPNLTAEVERRKASFLGSSILSTPCGFWCESDTLRRIFVQDRYLMQVPPLADHTRDCMLLARLISDDPDLSRAFDLIRAFDSKLTGRPAYIRQDVPAATPARSVSYREIASILPQGISLAELLSPDVVSQTRTKLESAFGSDAGFALCSYSSSPEYTLLLDAARNGTDFSVNPSLDLIIERIRRGDISLKPMEDSGWYDYQWYALETLILPNRASENAKLILSVAYQKQLEAGFKTAAAKNRETHIKNLPLSIIQGMSAVETAPSPKCEIHPEFSAEPTVTVFLRTARAYRFLHASLTTVLGEDALLSLRRTSSGNPEGLNLNDEVNRMSFLCYGLYDTVSTQLGLLPSYLPNEISSSDLAEARQIASQWLANPAADPDLKADARIAAPVALNLDGTVEYWGTGGVHLQRVAYEYKQLPDVSSVTPIFIPGYYYLPTDIALEFKRSSILSREEFRQICNSCQDEDSLRRLLVAPDRTAERDLLRNLGEYAAYLLAGIACILAWKTRKMIPRPVIRGVLAAIAVSFAGWVGLMCFSTSYRTKFIIRHLASLSPSLTSIYLERIVDNYGYREDRVISTELSDSLVDLLRDSDPQVRYTALTILCFTKRDDLTSVDGIEETLHVLATEPDPQIEILALQLLKYFHDTRNIEFLQARLNDATGDEASRIAAMESLAETTNPRGIADIIACARTGNRALSTCAIRMLGNYDDPRSIDLIASFLASGDEDSCRAAVDALRDFHFHHENHDISDRMNVVLLTAVRNSSFSADHRREFAEAVIGDADRSVAYELLLMFPGRRDPQPGLDYDASAARDLHSMRSSAGSIIPVLRRSLQNRNLDSDIRQATEKAIADLSG